ncbi:MAG TPA: hypothetical protein PLS49_00420 [Candidatus Woesebacteria bacterium]|nr:hypothetical protein [Candidatus Woesebacteria bacterium]
MNQTFQIKLSVDEGLKQTLDILKKEYSALDKAAIVRLALNNLAKEVRKPTLQEEKELFEYFDMLSKSDKGMTVNEVVEWWNKYKTELRSK